MGMAYRSHGSFMYVTDLYAKRYAHLDLILARLQPCDFRSTVELYQELTDDFREIPDAFSIGD
jgi:hypothetical protein